jgi:hypothetical protein
VSGNNSFLRSISIIKFSLETIEFIFKKMSDDEYVDPAQELADSLVAEGHFSPNRQRRSPSRESVQGYRAGAGMFAQ